jgi:hypothetical protein
LLCILILPLPRSGSSMVAGILHHLGVDMGPCKGPDIANPAGYFEDVRFLGLHRAWSRRYQTSRKQAQLKMPPWEPPLNETDLGRYARLIRVCEQRPCWGVKDPEFCYYARHFASILRHRILVISTIRNVHAAAASLGTVRGFSPLDCTMIIEEYARRQSETLHELATRGFPPALTIDYDEAIGNPEFIVKLIANYVDLPVTAAATAFISPELRRYRQVLPAHMLHNDAQGLTTLTT